MMRLLFEFYLSPDIDNIKTVGMVLGLFLRPLGHGIVIIHHVKSLLLPYIYTLAVPVH